MSEKRLREHKDVLSADSYGDMIAKTNLHNAAQDMLDALKQWKYATDTMDTNEYENAQISRDLAIAKAEGKK
jgi:hypothetical protein